MSVLRELQEHLQDEFDRELMRDWAYRKAEDNLHQFIEREFPPTKSEEVDQLVADVTSAVFHSAVKIGIRYGAKLTAELLK